MPQVQTVCGAIAPNGLGHCQIHEHIFVRPTPMGAQNLALCFEDPARSLSELMDYRAGGGSFLADAQPVAAGRDALVLEDLSRTSGVSIVGSTGYHLLGFYPENSWVHGLDEDGLCALYRGEAKLGMLPYCADPTQEPRDRTALRAGMVKAAIPKEGPVGRYAVLLRAAARAAAQTGLPLMLHTEQGENALTAIDLCRSLGVSEQKLVICHADRQATEFGVHDAIADRGVFMDYDTIGRFKYHSDEAEMALLRHMVDRGYGGQLLLSLDTTAARLGAYGGEISLRYLLDVFLPALRSAGFTPQELALMTSLNCRRLFAA